MESPGDGRLAIILLSALVIIVVWWRRQITVLKHDAEARASQAEAHRFQLQAALADAQEQASSTATDRVRLESALSAATEIAATQQSAVRQIASELSERLMAQQTRAFEQTTAALQQRADAEVRGMQQMFEQTSTERVQAQVGPLAEALERVAGVLDQTRDVQASSAGRVEALLQSLGDDQRRHWQDTRQLQSALRSSQIRGRVGEFTLQRILEDAGLREHVHFVAQGTDQDSEGVFRPDILVLLPGDRCIVVDSKAPLEHLLAAQATEDPATRQECITQHARALRRHVEQLSSKEYAARLQASERLTAGARVWHGVLLFVPTESVLDVALRRDPALLRYAAERHVYLVSPTTLLVVLNTAEQLWRQERLDRQADEIVRLGTELYERLAMVLRHVETLGGTLGKAVTAYNSLVGSVESRLAPTARELRKAGLRLRAKAPEVRPIEESVRGIGAHPHRLSESAAPDEDTRDSTSAPAAEAA